MPSKTEILDALGRTIGRYQMAIEQVQSGIPLTLCLFSEHTCPVCAVNDHGCGECPLYNMAKGDGCSDTPHFERAKEAYKAVWDRPNLTMEQRTEFMGALMLRIGVLTKVRRIINRIPAKVLNSRKFEARKNMWPELEEVLWSRRGDGVE